MTEAHGQYISSLFWCFISIGRLIAIPLAKIMSNKSMLIMELSIALTASIVLLCFSPNPTILWLFTCVFGLGMSAIWPTVMALIQSYIVITGKFSAAITVGSAFGEMVVPATIGLVMTEKAPVNFMIIILILVFTQILLASALFYAGHKTKSTSNPEKTATDAHAAKLADQYGYMCWEAGMSGNF